VGRRKEGRSEAQRVDSIKSRGGGEAGGELNIRLRRKGGRSLEDDNVVARLAQRYGVNGGRNTHSIKGSQGIALMQNSKERSSFTLKKLGHEQKERKTQRGGLGGG